MCFFVPRPVFPERKSGLREFRIRGQTSTGDKWRVNYTKENIYSFFFENVTLKDNGN